jgi:hypothetical protein
MIERLVDSRMRKRQKATDEWLKVMKNSLSWWVKSFSNFKVAVAPLPHNAEW